MPKKTSKKVPAKSGIQTRHATLPQSARASAIASSRARSRIMIELSSITNRLAPLPFAHAFVYTLTRGTNDVAQLALR